MPQATQKAAGLAAHGKSAADLPGCLGVLDGWARGHHMGSVSGPACSTDGVAAAGMLLD